MSRGVFVEVCLILGVCGAQSKHFTTLGEFIDGGRMYFGSEHLLHSNVSDVKRYIDLFTLPGSGLFIKGTPAEVREQLQSHDSATGLNDELVLLLTPFIDDVSSRTANFTYRRNFASVSFDGLTSLQNVKELWILMNVVDITFLAVSGALFLDISSEKFGALERLHVLVAPSADSGNDVILPLSFRSVVSGLSLLHLKGTRLRLPKPASEFSKLMQCIDDCRCFDKCTDTFHLSTMSSTRLMDPTGFLKSN